MCQSPSSILKQITDTANNILLKSSNLEQNPSYNNTNDNDNIKRNHKEN